MDIASFPDSAFEYYCLPVTRKEIVFKNNKVTVSEALPVLEIPKTPKTVLDSAIRFYYRLEELLKTSGFHPWIDYNEYPDGLLLIAALNKIGRAEELYRNLTKYFGLDGDISESYDPDYLDFLLQNQKSKKKKTTPRK
jgi:hypothetical protein